MIAVLSIASDRDLPLYFSSLLDHRADRGDPSFLVAIDKRPYLHQ
jgi:hypothetical protein